MTVLVRVLSASTENPHFPEKDTYNIQCNVASLCWNRTN